MVNITIYPYGNANERQEANGSYAFTCQHGVDECMGNLVETCFINLVSFNQDNFMDFMLTYEADLEKNSRDPYGTAQTILSTGSYAVTWDQMNSCLNSNQGNIWEHQMAVWTQQANHQYTPWITLNGKHTNTIQNECSASTLECTCSVYSGTNSCCKRFEEEPIDEVCYKDDKN
jgi:interferon gamma-inducible protein 30